MLICYNVIIIEIINFIYAYSYNSTVHNYDMHTPIVSWYYYPITWVDQQMLPMAHLIASL